MRLPANPTLRIVAVAALSALVSMGLVVATIAVAIAASPHRSLADAEFPVLARVILAGWVLASAALMVLGAILRWLRKACLRHHLIGALCMGAAFFAVGELIDAIGRWSRARAVPTPNWAGHSSVDAVIVENPYGCLITVGDQILPAVAMILVFATGGLAMKWLAHGIDRRAPVAPGWRIAGGVYGVALLVMLAGMVGDISGRFALWSRLAQTFCGIDVEF